VSDGNKPNILVIWGDDVGWSNLSCYNLGLMGYQMPNIDRLAGEGGCVPMPMASSPVLLGGRCSSWVSIRSGLGC
jgi:hypothetical protein